MRHGDEGGQGMRRIGFVLLICLPAMAAVTGTVVNQTTGKPQAGAKVGLYKLVNAFELAEQVKSDEHGSFTVNQNLEGANPFMIRATYEGVSYIHMIPPGSSSTGLTLSVFDSSTEPGGAKIVKHMILFQPTGGQMTVSETFLIDNDGKTAWNDLAHGALHFYLPVASGGKADVHATAPDAGGMGIAADLLTSPAPDVFGVNFPIKPGETRIDLNYTVPYIEGAPYQGKVVSKDENTYLVAPNGVTLAGDKLNDLGPEPRTQAHIYGLEGTAYKIQLTGAPVAVAADTPPADSADASDGAPQVEVAMPHVFGQVGLILGLALGILALGFAMLYRASATDRETNERGRG
jgi:hypothetical protein